MVARAPYVCTSCWRDFSSLTSFDKHQEGTDPVRCISPEEAGLVFNDWRNGAPCWSLPPSDYYEDDAA